MSTLCIATNYDFTNNRPITKSILAWWALNYENQNLPSLETTFEIEHIYAKKRQDNEHSLSSDKQLESLGNKVLLEKRVNIRAAEYRFSDKIKYYQGQTKQNEKTCIQELLDLSNDRTDFTETDIINRHDRIIKEFIKFLKDNELLKESTSN